MHQQILLWLRRFKDINFSRTKQHFEFESRTISRSANASHYQIDTERIYR